MAWGDLFKEGSKKVVYFDLKNGGSAKVRFIDDEPVARWTHWIAKAKRSVTCLGRETCPICEAREKEKDQKKKTYNSSKKFSMQIWNYETNRVEIIEKGAEFFKLLHAINTDEDYGDIKNFDITIKRMGDGTDTTWSMLPKLPSKFENEEEAKEELVDLKTYYKPSTVEQIEQLMEGKTPEEVFGNKENKDKKEEKKDDLEKDLFDEISDEDLPF